MNKSCYICKSTTLNFFKRNEINKNNLYLQQYEPFEENKRLSSLIKGDEEAIFQLKEEKETTNLLDSYNINRSKVLQVCYCSGKLVHPECLIKKCLLTVNFSCSECDSPYSLYFKKTSQNFTEGWNLIFKLIVIMIFCVALLLIAILLFSETIKIKLIEKVSYLNYSLGIIMVLLFIFLLYIFIKSIVNWFKLQEYNTYVVRDMGIKKSMTYISTNLNKMNVDKNRHEEEKKNSVLDLRSRNATEFIKEYYNFAMHHLNLTEMELANLKINNRDYLKIIIDKEKLKHQTIEESNLEIEATKHKLKEETYDAILTEEEKNILKKNLTRSKTCIKYERPSIYQEKYIEIPEIITYTIDEVYYEEQDKKRNNSEIKVNICEYNKLCIKKKIHKNNNKKHDIYNIFSISVQNIKEDTNNLDIDDKKEKKEKEKVNLLGGFLKKKNKAINNKNHHTEENKEKEKDKDKEQKEKENKDNSKNNSNIDNKSNQDNISKKSNNAHKKDGSSISQYQDFKKKRMTHIVSEPIFKNKINNDSNKNNSSNAVIKVGLLDNYLKKKRQQTQKVDKDQIKKDELLENFDKILNKDKYKSNKMINFEKENSYIQNNRMETIENIDKDNKSNTDSFNNVKSHNNFRIKMNEYDNFGESNKKNDINDRINNFNNDNFNSSISDVHVSPKLNIEVETYNENILKMNISNNKSSINESNNSKKS